MLYDLLSLYGDLLPHASQFRIRAVPIRAGPIQISRLVSSPTADGWVLTLAALPIGTSDGGVEPIRSEVQLLLSHAMVSAAAAAAGIHSGDIRSISGMQPAGLAHPQVSLVACPLPLEFSSLPLVSSTLPLVLSPLPLIFRPLPVVFISLSLVSNPPLRFWPLPLVFRPLPLVSNPPALVSSPLPLVSQPLPVFSAPLKLMLCSSLLVVKSPLLTEFRSRPLVFISLL